MDNFFTDFVLDSVHLGLESMQPGSLVLVVRSEEERRDLEKVVRENQEISEWRSVVAIKLEL